MNFQPSSPSAPAIFKGAVLTESAFRGVTVIGDFDRADLRSVEFSECAMRSASFRQANLQSAGFFGCDLVDADFSNANAGDAVFEDTDMTGARFDGADLAGAAFNSVKTDRVDFAKAKNYAVTSSKSGKIGPALTELDSIIAQARRIDFEFKVQRKSGGELEPVHVSGTGLRYGRGVIAPGGFAPMHHRQLTLTASGTILQLASRLRGWKVHYETLDVSSTKSPNSGKELREIVLSAISEAFAQPLPPADELAKATKEWRDGINKATSKEREARKLAKEKEGKAKAAEKKKLAKKIEKEVGKVTDVATFLKALELRVDVEKIKKATKMLRAERFQLFNDVTDTHLNGVVKSQTDADLVYACRIESDGKYACCTQNLNICGGLRGSICKHLLVLIIGLVQAGKLDPQTIDEWVAKSLDVKAELNKETMGEIFIRYKGAEAGEVDWRPTETMPEDYYAL
ncbi:MAG TPA: pentapeptide repeat-containing protein [Tepidisphaeraceae bacterium]|nr:pentapeptide repeat-containing protein [Tepidisphaeraceae bacterium]